MRTLLIPVLALSMAACGKNDQADNSQNMADSLTADSIVSNDVTAIDAVTGDAANMAADVDMNFGELDDSEGNSSAHDSSKRTERPALGARPKPAPEANTVANATANAE